MQVLDFIHCVSVAARIVVKKKKKHWSLVLRAPSNAHGYFVYLIFQKITRDIHIQLKPKKEPYALDLKSYGEVVF